VSKKSPHEYLVGYHGDRQCLYGKERLSKDNGYGWGIAGKMTAFQARRYHKNMPCDGARIFRVVDVTDEILGGAK